MRDGIIKQFFNLLSIIIFFLFLPFVVLIEWALTEYSYWSLLRAGVITFFDYGWNATFSNEKAEMLNRGWK